MSDLRETNGKKITKDGRKSNIMGWNMKRRPNPSHHVLGQSMGFICMQLYVYESSKMLENALLSFRLSEYDEVCSMCNNA